MEVGHMGIELISWGEPNLTHILPCVLKASNFDLHIYTIITCLIY